MPSSLGPAEILVILIVALIVLGPNKLPQAGRQVGRALAEVRRWSQDMKAEVTQAFDATPEPPRAPEQGYGHLDPTLDSSYEVIPPASADHKPPEVAAARPDDPTPTEPTPASSPPPDDRL